MITMTIDSHSSTGPRRQTERAEVKADKRGNKRRRRAKKERILLQIDLYHDERDKYIFIL